jgi:hypothetical protein
MILESITPLYLQIKPVLLRGRKSIFAGVLQVKKQSLLQAVLKCKLNEKLHKKRGVANDIAAPLFYYAFN